MRPRFSLLEMGCVALLCLAGPSLALSEPLPPRLAVMVVLDQMRGDEFPPADSPWPGALGRLARKGRVYRKALHGHAHTETASGHAVLGTGVHPRLHGISGKMLVNRDGGALRVVCDLGKGPCDPAWLAFPTLGDRLKDLHPGAKVAALSFKARSALLLGGPRADLTVWFRQSPLRIQVSHDDGTPPPTWLQDAFRSALAPGRRNWTWTLPSLPDAWSHRPDDGPDEWDPGYGITFPHRIPEGRDDLWAVTPDADRVVLDLALAAAKALDMGSDDIPDLLLVSLSVNDFVGHAFGPDSLERAATIASADLRLGEFLRALEDRAEGRLLVLLTADHGVTPTLGELARRGRDGGRVSPESLAAAAATGAARVAGRQDCVELADPPYLWLAPGCRDQATVAEAARGLSSHPAVYGAWPLSDLETATEPVAVLLRENTFPGRTGEIAFALRPGWYLEDPQMGLRGADHGSPWEDDRHVPLVLMGPGVTAGVVDTPVRVIDGIRELADRLGLPPVPGNGDPLP